MGKEGVLDVQFCSQIDVLAKDCIAELLIKSPVDSALCNQLLCVF